MRRSSFVLGFLGLVLAACPCIGATPGVTMAERHLATELQKRLTTKKTPEERATAFARVYLRRAYALDFEPAESIAGELLRRSGARLPERDQLQYFAWALDALVRGAALSDVKSTVKELLDSSYPPSEKVFFLELFMGVASCYASPLPLVKLTALADKNGIVGKQRQEFLVWIVDHIRLGEDPAHIKQIYDVVSKIEPSIGAQRAFLARCYNVIRQGVPPRGLADAVTRLGQKAETVRTLEEGIDRIVRLFSSGTPFAAAVDKVVPPSKKPEVEEEE